MDVENGNTGIDDCNGSGVPAFKLFPITINIIITLNITGSSNENDLSCTVYCIHL